MTTYDIPPRAAHVRPGDWLTAHRCLTCGQPLVDVSRVSDKRVILMCLSASCDMSCFYTFEADQLTPYCVLHELPLDVCACAKGR